MFTAKFFMSCFMNEEALLNLKKINTEYENNFRIVQ